MNFRRRKKKPFLYPPKYSSIGLCIARDKVGWVTLIRKSIQDTPVCGHLDFNCLKLKYEVKAGYLDERPLSLKDTPVCGHLDFNCLKLK